MTKIAELLDETLGRLDANRAQVLEQLVREALDRVQGFSPRPPVQEWPEGFFEKTAGALADEPFERADQGTYPVREDW